MFENALVCYNKFRVIQSRSKIIGADEYGKTERELIIWTIRRSN